MYNEATFEGVTCKARADYYHATKYNSTLDGNITTAENDVMIEEPTRCGYTVTVDGINERRHSLGLDASDGTFILPWFVHGTKVVRENDGAMTLSNICLHQPQIVDTTTTTSRLRFISYTPTGGDDERTTIPFYLHHGKTSPGTESLLKYTYPVSWTTWRDTIMSSHVEFYDGIITNEDDADTIDGLVSVPRRVEEATLFVPDWKESQNPGHCLNDLTFSVAMDVWTMENSNSNESELMDGRNVHNNTTPPPTKQEDVGAVLHHYPRFIHASTVTIHGSNKSTTCMQMLSTRFGFLGEQIVPKTNRLSTTDSNNTSTLICFASLTIPKLTSLRHSRSPTVDESLKSLRQRSFNVLRDTAGITDDPWPDEPKQHEEAEGEGQLNDDDDGEMPRIFMYDRSDASSRHLVNASHIKSDLEDNYHARVDHWTGTMWSALNLTSQLQVFNKYRYIISPHGAHLTNVLTSRPYTKILELQCTVNNRRWAQHQRWFSSWGPLIDLDWRVWIETDGCRDPPPDGPLLVNYSPHSIFVNVTSFAAVAAKHFALTPKVRPDYVNNSRINR
jgi:hypothetical protein